MEAPMMSEQRNMKRNRTEWGINVFVCALILLAGFALLSFHWRADYALRWLVISGGICIYHFVFLFRQLKANYLIGGEGALLPSLGMANQITSARAVMTAALAGFLFSPLPPDWLAWLPGMLYLLSSILDFLDGYIARVSHRATRLGELLDLKWDGAGVLIGAILAIQYGQVPVGYLLVGIARYLFMFGGWLRRIQGLPVYELDPNMLRRALAGTQMGFIAVVLLPVFKPPATQVAAVLFMLPFIIGFLRDWLWVSGQLGRPTEKKAGPMSAVRAVIYMGLPLFLRLALVGLLARVLLIQNSSGEPQTAILVVAGLALPALLLGAAGRIISLAVLFMSGFGLQITPLDWGYWLILFFSILLFLFGTGRFSLWKPEEWLIYHRPGEAQQ